CVGWLLPYAGDYW
nr:immunoglobulin heavy chain junction region [Mus musculus]